MENPTRRRVLAAGFAGTAFGLLGGRVASAGTTPPAGEDTAPTTAAPTTTLPPLQPTLEDVPLLMFAHGLELAARDLYRDAVAAGATELAPVLQSQHQAFADILLGILGTRGVSTPDQDFYEQFAAAIGVADAGPLAAAAFDLESALVATHTESLRQLQGLNGTRVIGSIITPEAQACTVLADAAGNGDDFTALFENDAAPLSPSSSATSGAGSGG